MIIDDFQAINNKLIIYKEKARSISCMNSDATSSGPNLLKLWVDIPRDIFKIPLYKILAIWRPPYTSFGHFQNISRAYNGANFQPIQWKSWFHFQLFHWISISSTFLHPHTKNGIFETPPHHPPNNGITGWVLKNMVSGSGK